MQNEGKAESSPKSFLHYFHPALCDHLSLIIAIIIHLMAVLDRFDWNTIQYHSMSTPIKSLLHKYVYVLCFSLIYNNSI